MTDAPHGPRLCGVHLSEAVGIFVEHYGVTREGEVLNLLGKLEEVHPFEV
jgi:hypothetical protein